MSKKYSSQLTNLSIIKELKYLFEYSCAVKPHVRSDGNRQSGTRKPLSASLLA